jgi:putative transcriptional regulator
MEYPAGNLGPMIHPWLISLVLACILSSGFAAAAEPAAGKLLVASRQMRGPTFGESVILLIQYSDAGAMGLIVNQPSTLEPARALPRLPQLESLDTPLYVGGPVARRRVSALVRADRAPAAAATILGRVHFSPLNDALLEEPLADHANVRLYMGYAGWGPGQLDAELARGSWHVVDADEDIVFSTNPADVWRRLVPARTYQVRAGTDSSWINPAGTRPPVD